MISENILACLYSKCDPPSVTLNMNICIGLVFLQLMKVAVAEELVDTTVILRKKITLDCMYSGTQSVVQYSWVKGNGSSNDQLCAFHITYGKHIAEMYKSRLSFVYEDFSADMSIRLTEASTEDLGIYMCYIALFPLGTIKKRVAVQSGEFSNTMPISQYTFAENSTITLNFLYSLKGDVIKVTLERGTDMKMDSIGFCEKQINSRKRAVYGFDFVNRSFMNCSVLHNITIFIYQASRSDEGLYKCNFNTLNQSQAVVVNMLLKKGLTPLNSVVLMYVGSLIVFLVIIITITTTVCIRRKRKQKRRKTASSMTMTFSPIYDCVDQDENDEHIYANISSS